MRPGLNSKRPRNHRANLRRSPQQGRSQSLDSNGPDVKVRGNASQIVEKYQTLARDANLSGDRIMAENYLQHAEHYFRVLNPDNATARPSSQPPKEGANGADSSEKFSGTSQSDSADNPDEVSDAQG